MRRKTTKKAGKFKNDSAFSLTLLTFIVMYVIAKLKMTLEWGVKSHLNFLLLGQDFMVLQKVSICRQMTLWRLKYNRTYSSFATTYNCVNQDFAMQLIKYIERIGYNLQL